MGEALKEGRGATRVKRTSAIRPSMMPIAKGRLKDVPLGDRGSSFVPVSGFDVRTVEEGRS